MDPTNFIIYTIFGVFILAALLCAFYFIVKFILPELDDLYIKHKKKMQKKEEATIIPDLKH